MEICQRCGLVEESFLRRVRDCPLATHMWRKLGFSNTYFFIVGTSQSWLKLGIVGEASHVFLTGIWCAWKARNTISTAKEPVHMYKLVLEV